MYAPNVNEFQGANHMPHYKKLKSSSQGRLRNAQHQNQHAMQMQQQLYYQRMQHVNNPNDDHLYHLHQQYSMPAYVQN